ncbi:MAG: acetolactate synthase small subunit [Rhodobacteraceae bacterium]|nr:acetolactate synthase small subunit [Paracoccaceae bacterium]
MTDKSQTQADDHLTNIYDGAVPVALLKDSRIYRHILSVLVDNEAGVLARVTGLFSGRGYNIESLTVSEVDRERSLSRINLVTSGTHQVIGQIKAQLGRLVPVHVVRDLTDDGPEVERELALLKMVGTGRKRVDALRLADKFGAAVVDSTPNSFIFQLVGTTAEIDEFIVQVHPHGLAEVSRTGVAAIAKGPRTIEQPRENSAESVLKLSGDNQ